MNQENALVELEQTITACRLCPRLVSWREEVARVKRRAFKDEEYWGKPVPGFGDRQARILIIGLAPGAHGSNRTGRMFTGDSSGDFLYRALFNAGFANQPVVSSRNDGLKLNGLYISALCRCVPPDNKPTRDEIGNCHPFLTAEIHLLQPKGIVALGKLAFDETVRYFYPENHAAQPNFAHGVFIPAGSASPWILGSYHPSRQNTQTGRLTVAMFDQIWNKGRELLEKG